jgi:putative ABC transport system ATP-binding protein
VDAVTLVLEAVDLYRFYHMGDDETLALRGVSLTAMPGEIVAVMGPSGCGKSTLLSCLAGLDEPSGGIVRICGERLSRRSGRVRASIRGEFIGVLFQSGNLLGHLDVHANVVLSQRLAGRMNADRADRVISQVGLSDRAHALPRRLSGGELARAGLAVALANDPRLLIADEPTGELDTRTASEIVALLRERAAEGVAVVTATHNPRVAEAADHIVELADGRVVV